jgi:PKHD-type hydroxylase
MDDGTAMNPGKFVTFPLLWNTYHYFQTYKARFTDSECKEIIDLHTRSHLVHGKILGTGNQTLRDSDIFWIPRTTDTDWLFSRLSDLVSLYNQRYGFELADDMGQAQLTRYRPGQHYEWHMDLGSGQPSLRKVTAVVELTCKQSIQGGGIEIFYGQSVGNKVDLDAGDVVLFPSFVMHRAVMVENGCRWSLVLWLNGTRPLR